MDNLPSNEPETMTGLPINDEVAMPDAESMTEDVPVEAIVVADEAPAPRMTPGPTPESRAHGVPTGVPVVFGDGQTWIIPHFGLAKGLAALRDEVYEALLAKQTISYANILAAAYYGLAVNYNLDNAEISALLHATDPKTIVDPICAALMPIEPARRTFTSWARSALLANGLMPSEIPAEDLPHVLDQLVRTGRAVPALDYTDIGVGVKTRANLLNMLTTD